MLPPGRFRLAARPDFNGSAPVAITIGIVEVAALAARGAPAAPNVTITATFRRTRSEASCPSMIGPCPQRNSNATFRPSIYPASRRPALKSDSAPLSASGELVLRNPITGILDGCADAASGHA